MEHAILFFVVVIGPFLTQAVSCATPPVADSNENASGFTCEVNKTPSSSKPTESIIGLAAIEKRSFTQAERIRVATALRLQTSKLLREEATASGAAQRKATRELVQLFVVIRHHEALTDNQRDKLRWKIRSRLKRISEHYQKALDRNRTARAKSLSQNDQGGSQRPSETEEQNGFGTGSKSTKHRSNNSFLSDNQLAISRTSSLQHGHHALVDVAEHYVVLQPTTVGNFPSTILAQVGAGGPGFLGGPNSAQAGLGTADTGEELVELIQAVIAPETWDINGGQGSVYYYRPLRVLVISAPG